jgi:integrase/recombinase XerD
MKDLLNDYLMYIQVEKNLADRTVQEYRMDLELLISFLQDRKRSQWQEVTHHDLRHFLFHLQQVRKNSATARARKVSSIKGFFRYLYEEGYISSNPSLRVSKPKLEKKLPFYLTQEDCLRFIQVVHEQSRQKERDLTIILMFLYTGMRLSELTLLDVHHLNLSDQTVRVYGKGRKERILPILPPLMEQLATYLQFRKEALGIDEATFTPLFFSRRNHSWQRIHKRTIHEIFMKYSTAARLDQQHFSAHKLRHTFATLLLNQGVNLIELKNLLGHNHLNTTEIYTHTSTDQLKQALHMHPLTTKNIL